MEKMKSIKSIAYILSGSLLYEYNGLSGGWTSGLAAIFGFIIFIMGLNMLKSGLDQIGKRGASLMVTGAVIGGISSFFDMIPIVGQLSGLGFVVSFIFILLGLLRLQKSPNIGFEGKRGTSQVVSAMIVAIMGAFISLMPFLGSVLASVFALTSMMLSFSGWLKIQNDLANSLPTIHV